jgi:hypothetical protein
VFLADMNEVYEKVQLNKFGWVETDDSRHLGIRNQRGVVLPSKLCLRMWMWRLNVWLLWSRPRHIKLKRNSIKIRIALTSAVSVLYFLT